MATDIQTLRPYLQDFDLTGLMVEGLGWNHHRAAPIAASADGGDFELLPVAEKAGFAVYRCGPGADGAIPPQSVRRRIEKQVEAVKYEHLIIFVDAAETRQVWQWVKRESGRPPAVRELRYEKGQPGTLLLQRLRGIEFTLEEEGNLGITDVTGRLRQSLDVERVTKRFYDRFRKELTDFQKFIEGFAKQGDRDWYASLMLNRLMFVYFIQKQGFLDGDADYLKNRLEMAQNLPAHPELVEGRFQRFYREFLLRLFHEGLGKPEADRPPELTALLGKVPYLNGGIFDPHALERDNPGVGIPDSAFRQVFDFFDQYQWHLDDRPTGADNEINPDVLGYIFEKYVNQKQMGAYYTKEDITGYIARNTVIPRLLEMARADCPVAFDPGGGVWRLLRDDPDNYIYPALGHGVAWDYSPGGAARLEEPLPLPGDIAAGLDDPARRDGWNRAAPPEYALPTETWRELIARRQRYEEVRGKLAAGEAQDVNDLITLNLDSERFARDVIVNSEGPELVRAIWRALTRVSVLDPACGSGAFLFAALNILEPLYSAVMQAMRDFREDLETSRRPRSPNALSDFREALDETRKHRRERYHILKSIIINNLYGVDIMEEAVEICRLRLFLKLAAQLDSVDEVEPLPDIDFNIQPGNTLVGFTSAASVRQAMEMTLGGQRRMLDADDEAALNRIETAARDAAREHRNFQQIQTEYGMQHDDLAQSKQQLQSKLDALRAQLDALLAKEYGVDADKPAPYQQWRNSHQPFHWFVEFHGIMSNGGFDAVIGNPPYVEYSKVKSEYTVKGYETESCGNLYAFVMERGASLDLGRMGLIVPISWVSTKRMENARGIVKSRYSVLHVTNYADRPSSLFEGVHQKLSIVLCANGASEMYTTAFRRCYSREGERDFLFNTVVYQALDRVDGLIHKYRANLEHSIIRKVRQQSTSLRSLFNSVPSRERPFYLNQRLMLWVKSFLESKNSKEFKAYYPVAGVSAQELSGVFNSSLFFWHWDTRGDCWHLVNGDIESFCIDLSKMKPALRDSLIELSENLERDLEDKKEYVGTVQTDYEYYHRKSKSIIDEIDRVLAEHYGFTEEELDFIINYDIKYRMGREG